MDSTSKVLISKPRRQKSDENGYKLGSLLLQNKFMDLLEDKTTHPLSKQTIFALFSLIKECLDKKGISLELLDGRKPLDEATVSDLAVFMSIKGNKRILNLAIQLLRNDPAVQKEVQSKAL
ncbi:MAG: hypothetical protein HYY52_05965 [Candidatus Melainabacteria bacterium]|nr:hypothetical protein [Candidatus Melainabacteria bacterium]